MRNGVRARICWLAANGSADASWKRVRRTGEAILTAQIGGRAATGDTTIRNSYGERRTDFDSKPVVLRCSVPHSCT
ncbi:MAG: hypothetical protein NVS9B14_16880 [Candidatus Acidiferrum sp.]